MCSIWVCVCVCEQTNQAREISVWNKKETKEMTKRKNSLAAKMEMKRFSWNILIIAVGNDDPSHYWLVFCFVFLHLHVFIMWVWNQTWKKALSYLCVCVLQQYNRFFIIRIWPHEVILSLIWHLYTSKQNQVKNNDQVNKKLLCACKHSEYGSLCCMVHHGNKMWWSQSTCQWMCS